MGGAWSEVHAGTAPSRSRPPTSCRWRSPVGPSASGCAARRRRARAGRRHRRCRAVDPAGGPGAGRDGPALHRAVGPSTGPRRVRATGPVRVRIGRVNAVLGTTLGPPDVRRLLEPIGFAVGGGSRRHAGGRRPHLPPRCGRRSTSSRRSPATTATHASPGAVSAPSNGAASPPTSGGSAGRGSGCRPGGGGHCAGRSARSRGDGRPPRRCRSRRRRRAGSWAA